MIPFDPDRIYTFIDISTLVTARFIWVTNAHRAQIAFGHIRFENGYIGPPSAHTKKYRREMTSKGVVGIYRLPADHGFCIVSTRDAILQDALEATMRRGHDLK